MVEVSKEVVVAGLHDASVGDLAPAPIIFVHEPAPPVLAAASTLNIEVGLIGGGIIANLEVDPNDTVYTIRKQLRQRGLLQGLFHTQLVCGGQVVHDNDRLRDCDLGPRVLTLVVRGPSALAEFLEEQGGGGKAGSVIDIVDSVSQVQHDKSTQYQPDAAKVVANVQDATRKKVLQWLHSCLQRFDLEPALMHGAALTLDRYSATRRDPVPGEALCRLCLAALCTEMKLAGEADWKRILEHFQGQETLQAILQTEMQMLSALHFVVNVPTPLTFLGLLGSRLHNEAHIVSVATFLVGLALFDVALQYAFPASVLAAGAIGVSLFVHPRRPDETFHLHAQLSEDILGFSSGSDFAMRDLRSCEFRIARYWADCDDVGPQHYLHMRQEPAVVHLNPAEVLARLAAFDPWVGHTNSGTGTQCSRSAEHR